VSVLVIGLTGSIGMGKTTAARAFRGQRVPVHDSDLAVHALLARGGAAVRAVEAAFPGVVHDGAVDRAALGARVFGAGAELRRLEAILHPIVRLQAARFLAACARRHVRVAVLDIPLLFESGAQRRVDRVVVASAPGFIQEARVLRRPGMTRARLAQVLDKQTPDRDKRRRADFVIRVCGGRDRTWRAVAALLRRVRPIRGRVWRPGYGASSA
jgi:dephospho-CoA kinase